MKMKQCIQSITDGKFVIVRDSRDREDEADLIIAAEMITVEQMAFLIRHTSGIICVPMLSERLAELELELITTKNTVHFKTPFTVPVDYLPTSRGGVSAEERVNTVRALIDINTKPDELGRPGHVFPLFTDPGGLKSRQGHTEAAMELVMRAGMYPAAVIGELINDNGTMMRSKELANFADAQSIPICSIEDIITSE